METAYQDCDKSIIFDRQNEAMIAAVQHLAGQP